MRQFPSSDFIISSHQWNLTPKFVATNEAKKDLRRGKLDGYASQLWITVVIRVDLGKCIQTAFADGLQACTV
jgi:hypothetical protein